MERLWTSDLKMSKYYSLTRDPSVGFDKQFSNKARNNCRRFCSRKWRLEPLSWLYNSWLEVKIHDKKPIEKHCHCFRCRLVSLSIWVLQTILVCDFESLTYHQKLHWRPSPSSIIYAVIQVPVYPTGLSPLTLVRRRVTSMKCIQTQIILVCPNDI